MPEKKLHNNDSFELANAVNMLDIRNAKEYVLLNKDGDAILNEDGECIDLYCS